MTREELAHILRAASQVADDNEIVVVGSQSILGSFEADALPDEATRSIEADIAFVDDPDENKSDLVDGGIGEESSFHEMYGYYGQGVSIAMPIRARPCVSTRTTWSSRSWSQAARRICRSRVRCFVKDSSTNERCITVLT